MASRFVVGNLLCNWNDDVTWWICQNNFNMNLIDKRPKGCRSRQISQKCPKCIRYTFFVSNKKVSFLCIERWISNDKHYKRKECQKMFIINVLHFDCVARTRQYGNMTRLSYSTVSLDFDSQAFLIFQELQRNFRDQGNWFYLFVIRHITRKNLSYLFP